MNLESFKTTVNKKMETINDRLQGIVDTYFKGNVSEFCRDIGVSQSTMNDILGVKRMKPSASTLMKIINGKTVKTDISYLMTGISAESAEPSAETEALRAELKVLWEINAQLRSDLESATSKAAVAEYRLTQRGEQK